MKAVNKRKKSLLLYVNLFVLSVRRGGRGASDSREALSRETNEDPNERRGVRIVAKGGKKILRENRFQVPDSRSGKRLLFQRNFYIYPLVKRKPRICFYSRILLVTSHSGSPFLFLSFPFFSLFFARDTSSSPPLPSLPTESLLHATRSLILAIFSKPLR